MCVCPNREERANERCRLCIEYKIIICNHFPDFVYLQPIKHVFSLNKLIRKTSKRSAILLGDKPKHSAGSFYLQLLSSTKARRVDNVYATFLSLFGLRYSAASKIRTYTGRSNLISSQTH